MAKPFFELMPPSHPPRPRPRIWLQNAEGAWELVPFPRPVNWLEMWGPSYYSRGFIQYTGDQERWLHDELVSPIHWYTDLVDSLQCVWIALKEIVWRVFHA